MLRGFSVTNFKSFNSRQVFSLAAGKIRNHSSHVISIGDRKILKSGLIYGANASGKSNLIQAMHFSQGIILQGLDRVNLSNKYFRISEDAYQKPGVFEYDIMVNNKEYLYGFAVSYSHSEIVSEWLIRVEKSGKEFTIFDRNLDDDHNSTIETSIKKNAHNGNIRLESYFEDFKSNVTSALRKKTMLNDIASRSNAKTGALHEIVSVFHWFTLMIVLFPDSKYTLTNELASDDSRKDFFQTILSDLDTGIETISEQQRAMDFDKVLSQMPHELAEDIKAQLSNEASSHPVTFKINDQIIMLRKDDKGNLVYHNLMLNHGNQNDPFEYADESDGTKRLFDLIPLLYSNDESHVIVIDEIDRSLHTNLTRKFIELFYQYTKDNNSQLIATTHDSNLMDLDFVRQDEIWFVERQEDHSSCLYSLNKFKQRFDKVLRNDYLIGRYGAIPMFKKHLTNKDIKDAE